MAKRKRSVGELISSLVFFFMGLWLIREGQYLFLGGEVFKGLIVILGGTLSFLAAFRFQIQKLFGDKDEYTVVTDNIARAVTNLEYEHTTNETKREINILKTGYLQLFINDLRDIVKYDKSSSYITSALAQTENTELVNP